MNLKTCPKCGSTSIRLNRAMAITGIKYVCDQCGYEGDIIVESDIEKKFKT